MLCSDEGENALFPGKQVMPVTLEKKMHIQVAALMSGFTKCMRLFKPTNHRHFQYNCASGWQKNWCLKVVKTRHQVLLSCPAVYISEVMN